jgi:anti-sigma regulatory factor (Ser/Thr protein kinase)
MKSHPKSASPQLNLALLDRAPAELPQDQQQELSLALVELLVNAATPRADQRRSTGGQNEFETHE